MPIRQTTSRTWSASTVDWNNIQISRRNIRRDSWCQINDSAGAKLNNCIQSQQRQNTTTSTWTILPNGRNFRKSYWSLQSVTVSSVTTRNWTGEMDEQKRWSFRRNSRRNEVHQQQLASWNRTLLAVIFSAGLRGTITDDSLPLFPGNNMEAETLITQREINFFGHLNNWEIG